MFNLFYNFSGLNTKFFLIINHYANVGILPYILQCISFFFSLEAIIVYYITGVLYFFYYIKKKNPDDFWSLYYKITNIGTIFGLLFLVYLILKYTVNLPRPYCTLPQDSFVGIATLSKERCLSSFPSFHTAAATLITYIMLPFLKSYYKILPIIMIFIVGISRISLAMHFPADIIYSIPITLLVIFTGNRLFKLFQNNLIKWIGDKLRKIYCPGGL
jgi:membrane-associated phospholipid phosphatase